MLLNIFMVLMFILFFFAVVGLQLFSGLLKNRCMISRTGKPYLDDGNDIICGHIKCPNSLICVKMIASPNGGITNFDNILYSML